MIHKSEIQALEDRAIRARISMPKVCDDAGIFRQSWYRARKRGRMEYPLYRKLADALDAIENKA